MLVARDLRVARVHDRGVAEHVDVHVLVGEGPDRVALASRLHPLLARHRLGVQVDRHEAEARPDDLLERVHVALLHRAHPVLLQAGELGAVLLGAHRREASGRAVTPSVDPQPPQRPPTTPGPAAKRGVSVDSHTGQAAGAPARRPSQAPATRSSSVGPWRCARAGVLGGLDGLGLDGARRGRRPRRAGDRRARRALGPVRQAQAARAEQRAEQRLLARAGRVRGVRRRADGRRGVRSALTPLSAGPRRRDPAPRPRASGSAPSSRSQAAGARGRPRGRTA